MKKNLILFFFAISSFSLFLPARANSNPVEIRPAPVSEVFIPKGFDDNDSTEIVFHGYFGDTCYNVGGAEVVVHKDKKAIEVKPLSHHLSNVFCLQMIVPFTQVVRVGLLDKGLYKIETPTHKNLVMPVSTSPNSGPDDFLYAPVSDALYHFQTQRLEVRGAFSNDCMVLKEVRINEEEGHILAVLPIAQYQKRANCKNGVNIPFKAEVILKPREQGIYLLHVRSLNGIAINKVVNIY